MGLINKNKQQDKGGSRGRPADWAYLARFDIKDLPYLEEMARHIRETHDTKMIENFNLKCEQKLSGKTASLDNGLEIKAVTKTGDMVLNGGLDQCIKLILGIDSVRWSHFGMSTGSGGSVPVVTNTALVSEVIAHRVLLAWAEPVGMKMFFGGISSQSGSSAVPPSIGEIGVYNGSSAGAILLNRSFFPPNAPTIQSTLSTANAAPIVVSAVIEFCPVV